MPGIIGGTNEQQQRIPERKQEGTYAAENRGEIFGKEKV